MGPDIRRLVDQHHIFYEVSPYYVVNEIHKNGAMTVHRNIQAGFDIDLYGTGIGADLKLSPDSEQAHLALHNLERVAQAIAPQAADSQIIEVLPGYGTLYLDAAHHLRLEAMVRIRITHSRGIDQPAGPLETRALETVQEQLRALGVNSGREGRMH
jgi:hypothetical protein